MKVLVTGALGLTGTAVFDLMKEKGHEVVGIDNNMRSYFFGVEKTQRQGVWEYDIRNEEEMNRLFSLYRFDAIVHTAAQPSHDWAKKEPLTDFDTNARATLVLLEATRKFCDNATFVHLSTDKVYGENMRTHVGEFETRFQPINNDGGEKNFSFDEELGLDFAGERSLFGCSKTAADLYVQEYGNYFGMNTVCFRPGCITGKVHKGAEEHGFLAYLASCIKKEKPYKIYGYKGKQVRDQIHAYDIATAINEFIQTPRKAAVYNIGGGPARSVSVLEAIELIEKETGKKAIIEHGEARKGDRIWDVHDVSKFRSDYPNWDYKYDLSAIIKELCE